MSMSLNSSTASNSSYSRRVQKKKILSDYEEVTLKNKSTSELGKGSYGCVKLVKDKEDGILYAMKIVNCSEAFKIIFFFKIDFQKNHFRIFISRKLETRNKNPKENGPSSCYKASPLF